MNAARSNVDVLQSVQGHRLQTRPPSVVLLARRSITIAEQLLARRLPLTTLAGVSQPATAAVVLKTAKESADFVRLVSDAASSDAGGAKKSVPVPSWPPSPTRSPFSDSPASSGGSAGGGGGAAGFFVAVAFVSMLLFCPPGFFSRISTLLCAPLSVRRRLSLECPG